MTIVPPPLKAGDEIRILGLSRSLGGVLSGAFHESDVTVACSRLEALGMRVSFGRHVHECNEHLLASIESRLADLHEALSDKAVKAILAVTGGAGASQLLDRIDYTLVKANPKIMCGYSDCAHIFNAIVAQTGMVTYYGPNFTSFMAKQGTEYTCESFKAMLFTDGPVAWRPPSAWSDDNWAKDQAHRTFLPNEGPWSIQPGKAGGIAIGGNSWCLNMLQGSEYFPSLEGSILFLESPGEGKASLIALDGSLRALSYQKGFGGVRGIVLGRYPRSAGVTREGLTKIVASIPALASLPIAANCDFGHTMPVMPIPLGAPCTMEVQDRGAEVTLRHRVLS